MPRDRPLLLTLLIVFLVFIQCYFFQFPFDSSRLFSSVLNSVAILGIVSLKTMPILMDWGEYNCIFQVTLDLSIKCLILLGVINMIVLYCIYTRL